MIGEGEHLGEIAHGRLWHVGLPVGVGRKGRCGVEGEVRRDCCEMLRVQRQDMLQAFYCVCNEKRYKAEDQHGDGVFGPAHLVGLVDAGEPVDEAFERAEDEVGEGALALKDAGHVEAERLCAEQDEQEEQADLEPADGGHGAGFPLELFRLQESVDEIDEQAEDDEKKQSGFDHDWRPPGPSRSQPVV